MANAPQDHGINLNIFI